MDRMKDIKLVVLDLEGTFVKGNSWQRLNFAMGMTKAEDDRFYEEHRDGKINYQQWIEKVIAIYRQRGSPRKGNIIPILLNYDFFPGAHELVDYLKRYYEVALISGAVDIVVQSAAKSLGIRHMGYHGQFVFGPDGMLERVETVWQDGEAKLENLKRICKELGITLQQCICIGDSHNDLELFRATAGGITFSHCCEEIRQCCRWEVRDLFAIKHIL